MLSISTFINEQLLSKQEILSKIVKCEFDFSSCSNMGDSTKEERIKKAKAQEEIVINVLKSELQGYDILSCEDWCKQHKLNYSPKIDSCYGDIMICQEDKTLFNIDLKVGTKTYIGTPDALSLTNFGDVSVKEAGIFVYLCCNESGKNNYIISNKKLNSIQKTGKFIVSVNRTNELRNSKFANAKVYQNKKAENNDTSKLFEEDFVPETVIIDNATIKNS